MTCVTLNVRIWLLHNSKVTKHFGPNSGMAAREQHFHKRLLSKIIRTEYKNIVELERLQQTIANGIPKGGGLMKARSWSSHVSTC